MKNSKRFLALFLTAGMLVSSLAGCQSAANSPSQSASGTASAAAKPVLKALVPNNGGFDWNNPDDPVLKFITEKTGYKVQYDILPADNPNDKLNAIMAAGADYDFIVVNDKSRYAEYASEGALQDMQPLVQKYGPNISANVPKALFDVSKVGDTYYAIPTVDPSGREESSNVSMGLLVRTDILDQMKIQKPTTLDEFSTMLSVYKQEDPKKNGSENVSLSLTMDDLDYLRTSGIGGAFGIENDWKDDSGKLVPYQTQQGFYDFIVYLRKLYTDGLMDAEMPTNQASTVLEKFTKGKALSRVDGYWSIPTLMSTFQSTDKNATMEFIQPLAKDGKVAASANSANQVATFTVIPKNAKNPEAAMDYLNQKLDPTFFKEMVLGKEGTDYTVKGTDDYYPVLPTFFTDRGSANNYVTGSTADYGKYWLCRARKDENQYKAYSQLNYDYGKFITVDQSTDMPCSSYSKISSDTTNSKNMTKEFIVNSIVSGITKESFDSFIANWKAQTGDKLTQTYNDWYTKK